MPIFVPTHGGQLHTIAKQFDVNPATLVDFSASINPDGPPSSVIRALRIALDNPDTLTMYPDLEERRLRQALADYGGTASDNIIVANGFAPLLEAKLRTTNIQSCLLVVPCFGEYRRILRCADVAVAPYPVTAKTSFRLDTSAVLETIINGRHDALLLANPQNPSGRLHKRSELLPLVERVAEIGGHVLLDEAFIDYTPAESLVHYVDRLPNLTIFRSVTKFFGIPGLRVAYAVAKSSEAQAVRDAISPWAITNLASLGVAAAVTDTDFTAATLIRNEFRRESLARQLFAIGVTSYASSANYLLLGISTNQNVPFLWKRLIVEYGIVVRNCSTFEALSPNHLRCAVRTDIENQKLVAALSSLIAL